MESAKATNADSCMRSCHAETGHIFLYGDAHAILHPTQQNNNIRPSHGMA